MVGGFDGTQTKQHTTTLAIEPEPGKFMEANKTALNAFAKYYMDYGGYGPKRLKTASIIIPPGQENAFLTELSQETFKEIYVVLES
jgi:hypothetical protein